MEIGRWLNFFSNLIKFKNPTTEYNDKEEEEKRRVHLKKTISIIIIIIIINYRPNSPGRILFINRTIEFSLTFDKRRWAKGRKVWIEREGVRERGREAFLDKSRRKLQQLDEHNDEQNV